MVNIAGSIHAHARRTSWPSLLGGLALLAAMAACTPSSGPPAAASVSPSPAPAVPARAVARPEPAVAAPATPASAAGKTTVVTEAAVFAGGCFWCMEPPFDELPGVISTTSGYIGGHVSNPSYEQVSAGGTGHAEAVRVIYDPRKVTYPKLLEVFWHNIDPVAVDRQFCDAGSQYRSAIFPVGEAQRRQAEASRRAVQADPRFTQPIATRIEAAATFYPAEDYHQDYYKKNPIRYKYYRHGCGRDRRLQQVWGDAG